MSLFIGTVKCIPITHSTIVLETPRPPLKYFLKKEWHHSLFLSSTGGPGWSVWGWSAKQWRTWRSRHWWTCSFGTFTPPGSGWRSFLWLRLCHTVQVFWHFWDYLYWLRLRRPPSPPPLHFTLNFLWHPIFLSWEEMFPCLASSWLSKTKIKAGRQLIDHSSRNCMENKNRKNVQAVLAIASLLSHNEPCTKAWSHWPPSTWWGDYHHFVMIVIIILISPRVAGVGKFSCQKLRDCVKMYSFWL